MNTKTTGRINKPSVIFLNEKGFTLLELLFSLVTFLAVTALVLQLVTSIYTAGRKDSGVQPKEWEIFIGQLKRQVNIANGMEAGGGKIHLLIRGQLIEIQQYQDKVRRLVDGAGHDVMLQHAASFTAKKEGGGLLVSVTDLEGKIYAAQIYPLVGSGRRKQEEE